MDLASTITLMLGLEILTVPSAFLAPPTALAS